MLAPHAPDARALGASALEGLARLEGRPPLVHVIHFEPVALAKRGPEALRGYGESAGAAVGIIGDADHEPARRELAHFAIDRRPLRAAREHRGGRAWSRAAREGVAGREADPLEAEVERED